MDWRTQVGQSGFAILPKIFAPADLNILLREIEISSARASRAGIRHAMALPLVATFSQKPELLDLARAILGSQAFPFRATLFNKSPRSNWLVVWHQDTALPLRTRLQAQGWGPWSVKEGIDYAHAPASALSQVLALRIHLDDSTMENGPLRVLPGTQTLGVLDDDAIHELAVRITPVDCTAPKGSVVAMRPLIVHASSKSNVECPRRVLHIEYAASELIAAPLQLAIAYVT
jgi:ectoine hydroxylase-related dioxygenase (phytanoyl-CoA dioxygenase family)